MTKFVIKHNFFRMVQLQAEGFQPLIGPIWGFNHGKRDVIIYYEMRFLDTNM